MRPAAKKVLCILILLLTVFGWWVTFWGIPGVMDPISDKLQKGLDIEGGVYVVLEAQGTEDMSTEELRQTMEQTKAVIENRIDSMGLTNPNVTIEGGNRIRVELPGVSDVNEAISLIGKTAQLKFVLADGTFILDGSSVKDASTTTDTENGGYAVSLEFTDEGATAFTAATEKTASNSVTSTMYLSDGTQVPSQSIVIMLDDEIISYPIASKVINDSSCLITGNFTKEEASNLAALIRGGALPVELKEISSSSQTATIGMDAFDKSVIAGAIGLGIIFLILIFGYRIMGLAADLALALYVIIIIDLMALVGNVLTLPGIAGIILSIGMAVDANVIIFTRIKEEIVAGKSVRVAVKTGYKRALSSVIDSQVTTLIATVILYQMGTSSVKGFAWTLMIGILASIFTAVIITQVYLSAFIEVKAFTKESLYGVKDGKILLSFNRHFHFIKHRRVYFSISAVIIVVGLIVGFAGGFNPGIDFTGGTMIHMDMHKQVSVEAIKDVADGQGINTRQMEIVFTGSDNEEVLIKTNESLSDDERDAFVQALEDKFGTTDEDVLESDHFGPTVGKELTRNALISLALAAVGMLIYIRLRFRQWRYGASAILGVLHDVLILLAFYAIFGVTINNPFIAAILTVVGYSINDTIVIFDRVRENERLSRQGDLESLLDTSINQTLSRSVMTSLTTLVVMVPMLIMTGSTIREFVLPLMVGVIAGTYSSIFVCSPLYYVMSMRARRKRNAVTRNGRRNPYRGAKKGEKPYTNEEKLRRQEKRRRSQAEEIAEEARILNIETEPLEGEQAGLEGGITAEDEFGTGPAEDGEPGDGDTAAGGAGGGAAASASGRSHGAGQNSAAAKKRHSNSKKRKRRQRRKK